MNLPAQKKKKNPQNEQVLREHISEHHIISKETIKRERKLEKDNTEGKQRKVIYFICGKINMEYNNTRLVAPSHSLGAFRKASLA